MSAFISFLFEDAERPANWQDIYNEYVSLRENKHSSFVLNLMKDIDYLAAKYFIIEKTCTVLSAIVKAEMAAMIDDVPELIRTLKEYGFRHSYNVKDPVMFSKDMRAVLTAAKKIITTRNIKVEELEAYQKKYAGKEIQRKDFYVWAVTLSDHQKFYVDLDNVTVAIWCQMLNKYDSYCEVQNAKANNKLKEHGR